MAEKANLSFKNRFTYISVIDEANWGLSDPVIKSHPEEKVGWPWARKLIEIFGFPYNISATAGASDFKFGAQLGFAKAPHKITCRRKGEHGPGLEELPKIWGSPSILTKWLRLAYLKFGTRLRFAKAHHKKHTQRKSGRGLGLRKLPYIWGSFLIFLQQPHCPLSVIGASCY